jgi:hypothetical protein|tara:strand:+ start:374 stop:664 length:291 start_codon:yes stop_codon:yes gene_type:complete
MKFIHNSWNVIMDNRYNPLRNIPDVNTRHLIMQILAWMWCIIFSMWLGSVIAFGISAAIHALLIAGIFITVGVFETAKRKPSYFGGLGRGNGGEHE